MSEHGTDIDLRPGATGDPRLTDHITHPEPFLLDLHVQESQIHDAVDHVPNIEYVRWIDRAAELHADAVGFDRQRQVDDGVMWFVARHEIDYLGEVRSGERLLVATWIDEMSRVKAWRSTVVARRTDADVVLRARTLWVLVDLASRRPVRVSSEMVHAFAPAAQPEGT